MNDFINDKEKMNDFKILSKDDFLKSYSYLDESDYDITLLLTLLKNYENFTITEALKETKTTYDLLCIINNILYDVIDLTRYELETEEQKQDFEELKKIKDKILIIKNKNFK